MTSQTAVHEEESGQSGCWCCGQPTPSGLTGGLGDALRTRTVPSMARFDDRWRWLETSVVPRFRRLDADQDLVDRTLGHIVDEATRYAHMPCLVPT